MLHHAHRTWLVRRSLPILVGLALLVGLAGPMTSAPAEAAPDSAAGLPDRVVAGYWTYWSAPRLRDVPREYNTIYLFSARPVGGAPGATGAVFFDQFVQTPESLVEDIALVRSQGRTVILSVGGAGEYLNLNTAARTDAFVASIRSIYDQLGGFDGLDWNIESSDLPVANMVAASQRLKSLYGDDFVITTPPAPWREAEMNFVRSLRDVGAIDLVTPQYYDMPGFGSEADRRAHALQNIDQWVELAGGAHRVGFGFRNVGPGDTTMTVDSVGQVLSTALNRHPDLRGAMVWSIDLDRGIGYGFANRSSAVLGSAPPPSTPPTGGGSSTGGTGSESGSSPADPSNRFPDVTGGVHRDAIERMAANGTLQGYADGTFRPGHQLTRGQLATILARVLELDATACDGCAELTDVAASVHAEAIRAVVGAQIASGYPDGTFGPDRHVTREQLATFLAKGLDLPLNGTDHPFVDVTRPTHEEAITAIVTAGITEGRTPTTFAPTDPVTRGQMASLLDRWSAAS
jgi:chitinase